jgi:hypothetical protein
MNKSDRIKQELVDLTRRIGGGLSINYTSHHPATIDGVPCPWVVQVGQTSNEHYCGYGTSEEFALLAAKMNYVRGIVGARGVNTLYKQPADDGNSDNGEA